MGIVLPLPLHIRDFSLPTPVGTTSAILNRSGGSDHPFLVPYLKGKAFSLIPLTMVLAVDLS